MHAARGGLSSIAKIDILIVILGLVCCRILDLVRRKPAISCAAIVAKVGEKSQVMFLDSHPTNFKEALQCAEARDLASEIYYVVSCDIHRYQQHPWPREQNGDELPGKAEIRA